MLLVLIRTLTIFVHYIRVNVYMISLCRWTIITDDDDNYTHAHKHTCRYIQYARQFVKPVLREVDSEKIASLYAGK